MKRAVADLIASKKFLVALIASTMYFIGRCGLELNAEVLDRICLVLLVFIVAQAVADHGKEAAKVYSAACFPSTEVLKQVDAESATALGEDKGQERQPAAGRRAAYRRADTAPLRGPGVVASGALSVAPSEDGCGGRP